MVMFKAAELADPVTLNVIACMGFVYAFLFVITVWIMVLRKLNPHRDFTNLVLRFRTFWIIALLLGASLIVSVKTAIVFWAIVSYMALKEYFTIIPTRLIDRRVLFWAYISIPIQYYWVAIGWWSMFLIFIPVYGFLFLPFRMVILGETKGFLQAVGTLHWGVMMMVYCMSYIVALYMLNPAVNPVGGAQGLILYLLFLNQFNDAAQFFWGSKIGRIKIVPRVSPNKTLGGVIGGAVTTTFFAVLLAPFLTPITPYHAVLFGLMIALAGFIGDIVISALKRDLGIKDTGQILPGHGGILDRIDSLLFTTPLYFHLLRYLYY